jgi:hypothetical protein
MAKMLKAPVNVDFDSDHIDTIVLNTKFPVWAITHDGLVAGYLRQAHFEPVNECEGVDSIEVVFDRSFKGRLYGK